MNKIKPGDVFNFLTCDGQPYSEIYLRKNGIKQKIWKARFKCRCGMVYDIICNSVISGKTKSCGCYNKELASKLCLKNNIRKFTKSELKSCLNDKLTYKQIADKYSCTISLIQLRVKEYLLHKYYKYIGKTIGSVKIKDVIRIKGKYRFTCDCKCGTQFDARPSDVIRKITKSCGCLKPKVNGTLTRTVLCKIRAKARARNIECSITLEYLQSILDSQNSKCPYSGIEITFPASARDSSFTASLDRIDSTKGYIEDNVQWVDKRINSMKNDMSEQEFVELCDKVAKNKIGK